MTQENKIKGTGFEKRLDLFLDYMARQSPGEEFGFIQNLKSEMDLTEDQVVYACFVSVTTGDWDSSFEEDKRGKVTKYLLNQADPKIIEEDNSLAHELEENLNKKYENDFEKPKNGNHRNRLACYWRHSWEFNESRGGSIISAIRSYVDFLDGKRPAIRLKEFEDKEDPFDVALDEIKEIDTFSTLAAFDFLQALNYVLDYWFLDPSYIYSKNRGKNNGVAKGMRYLLYGNYKTGWKGASAPEVREVEREIIETTRKRLDWPDRKVVFDVESCMCNYQKNLDGDEDPEVARKKILKEESESSC